MSMIGIFRQVSPALLMRLKARPAILDEVLKFQSGISAPVTDAEALLSLLPPHMRKAIESMPEDARTDFLAFSNTSLGSRADMSPMLRQQLDAAKAPQVSSIDSADVGDDADVAKAWHGIHFLLCGTSGSAPMPLGGAVLGGTEIGDNRGYGPTRYLEPTEVAAVAAALDSITVEDFEQRYDAGRLEASNVYPGGWSDEADKKPWLSEAYAELRSFYAQATKRGFGVLAYLA
jgi:hypothetical protein